MRNLWISTQPLKSLKISPGWGIFVQYLRFEPRNTEELSFMTLNNDANLNKPWPYGFKNGMRNWVSFHEHSKVWKTVYWGALFVKSTVSSRKFQRKLCVMTLNADAKFKGKLTHGLKNNIKNLVNFHVTVKSLEICTLIG